VTGAPDGPAAASGSPLHAALEPLAALVGTFEGDGEGDYPTIEPFRYREEVVVGHVGTPVLQYRQRTWDPSTGRPMHAEVGFLRLAAPARVELLLAHPFGIAEVEEGTLAATQDGVVLELATTTIGRTATAKEVRALRRRFVLSGGELRTDLWMAHAATPETHHLRSVLRRTSGS
jgi:hypothetical protein